MEDYLPESICRTCLQRSDDLTSLHSKDGDAGLTLLDKLRFCASMQVPVSEHTPSNACAPCVRCITEYYDFKRRCEQSEKTLEELCAESSEDIVPKFEPPFEVKEEGVTKIDPDDFNSSCDNVSDLTSIWKEVDSVTIARDDECRSESDRRFACKTCGKRFTRNFNLQRHHRLMHEQRQSIPVGNESSINDSKHLELQSCNVCGVEFKSEEEQSTHVQTCRHKETGKILTPDQLEDLEKKPKHSCEVCSRTFSTNGRLKRHKRHQHSGRQHRCDQCGRSYSHAYRLRFHMKTHKEGSNYICKTCGKMFRSAQWLQTHTREHHAAEKPVYKCRVCGKTYNFICSLRAHERTHKPRKRKLNLPGVTFKCDICKKSFRTKLDLRKHVSRHLVRKRQCDGCKEVFDSLAEMLEHRSSAHPDLDPYVVEARDESDRKFACKTCGKRFTRNFNLQQHRLIHERQSIPVGNESSINHSKYLEQQSCNVCGVEFKSEEEQSTHVQTCRHKETDKIVPPGQLDDLKVERNHPCNMCSRSYPTLKCLKKHKMLCHSAPRYPHAYRRRLHMEKHTEGTKYVCKTCGKAYRLARSLHSHISEKHTIEKPIYTCKVCDKTYNLIGSYNAHRRMHKWSDVLPKCGICGKSFRMKQEQEKHVCKRQCDGCNEVFDSLPKMLEHRTSLHPDLDPYVDKGKNLTPSQLDDLKAVYKYQCDVCSRAYPTNGHLKRHKRLSHSERQHICFQCGASFAQPYLLRIHMSESHSAEKPVYECKECGKTYNVWNSLRAHRYKHKVQKNAGPKTLCDGCGEVFISLPKMLKHRASAHPNLDPYVVEGKKLTPGQINDPKKMQAYSCDKCSRSFATIQYLKSHKTQVHSNQQRHRCDQCGILFARAYHLHRHLKRVHTPGGKNKFICEMCGKEYSYQDSLRTHIEQKHAAEKPIYTCKICGKTYNIIGSYYSHKRTHKDIKDCFRCDRCDSAFPSKARLRRHIKQTHDKQYPCDMCDKRLPTEARLFKHKAYHADQMTKPYACSLCEKRFSTKSGASFHVSTLHHGKKHLKCNICGMEFYNRFHYASHCNKHKGMKPYKCDTCGKYYTFKPSYLKHRKLCQSQQAEDQREKIEVTSTSASKITSELPVINDLQENKY